MKARNPRPFYFDYLFGLDFSIHLTRWVAQLAGEFIRSWLASSWVVEIVQPRQGEAGFPGQNPGSEPSLHRVSMVHVTRPTTVDQKTAPSVRPSVLGVDEEPEDGESPPQGDGGSSRFVWGTKNATRNKCIATSNKCLTSSNKKLALGSRNNIRRRRRRRKRADEALPWRWSTAARFVALHLFRSTASFTAGGFREPPGIGFFRWKMMEVRMWT